MLDDNLNTRKLQEIIGSARFENPTHFKEFLRPQLLQHLALRARRMVGTLKPEQARYDFQIFDSLTNRETLLMIGLKTIKTTPQFTPEEIAAFQEACKKAQALFGCLMTETEVHFYEFTYEIKKGIVLKTDIKEISDIRPLNYIDAEFERVWNWQKVKDLMIAHKVIVTVGGIIIILLIASQLASRHICRESGAVKGVTNSQGVDTYYLPSAAGYNARQADIRFCTEAEAKDAGYTKGN